MQITIKLCIAKDYRHQQTQHRKMPKSSCFLGLTLLLFAIAVASVAPLISTQPGKLYIIFGLVQRPEESTALCLRTLAKVFGSEKAANEAVVYTYASLGGIAARLAPDQASRLSQDKRTTSYAARPF